MSRLARALGSFLADIRECNYSVALVGGIAVSARTEPRFTRDVDLAVDVASDAEAEQLIRGLISKGYTTSALIEHEVTHRLATIRLVTPRESAKGVVIDLLFASSGIEAVVVAAAQSLEIFPGVFAPVACVGHLIALKLLARDDRNRPQDWDDLRALFAVADSSEIERARSAVRMIERSGNARGRNLTEALEEWKTENE